MGDVWKTAFKIFPGAKHAYKAGEYKGLLTLTEHRLDKIVKDSQIYGYDQPKLINRVISIRDEIRNKL